MQNFHKDCKSQSFQLKFFYKEKKAVSNLVNLLLIGTEIYIKFFAEELPVPKYQEVKTFVIAALLPNLSWLINF